LYADFVEIALHLEERFYPHLLTTIVGHRWLITYDIELAIAKCLNSSEYLFSLGAAIGKDIEKGMQDGLDAGITHGKVGRVLADVAAYNPSAKVDYVSALKQLQSVNFSLLTELKLNKDSSVETLMNILLLEETLTESLDLNKLQPHVDQLMSPFIIHLTKLSLVLLPCLSLDVSHARVQKIRENITNYRSALHDVFIPLVEPFSTMVVASTGTVRPISIDDYEVFGTDDQATVDGNVADEDANPFLNVDDAELNVPE
nr:cold-regulated 47 [Tanacetum cinerariifolium]